MNIHKMNVSETIGEAEKLLHEEKNISPALRSVDESTSVLNENNVREIQPQ